uniref:Uncharacterized protein n=1 Tax=Anopheles coluzzii TaxID=1518534 RepID=A0A8W7PU92_ANOCL
MMRNQPLIFQMLSLLTMLGMFRARALRDSILLALLAYFLPCMLCLRYSDGWTAAGTVWPMSAHWQREIAYFDLFIATILIWTARQPDLRIKRNITLLLCGLSLLLGENHLEGWLAAPQ